MILPLPIDYEPKKRHFPRFTSSKVLPCPRHGTRQMVATEQSYPCFNTTVWMTDRKRKVWKCQVDGCHIVVPEDMPIESTPEMRRAKDSYMSIIEKEF